MLVYSQQGSRIISMGRVQPITKPAHSHTSAIRGHVHSVEAFQAMIGSVRCLLYSITLPLSSLGTVNDWGRGEESGDVDVRDATGSPTELPEDPESGGEVTPNTSLLEQLKNISVSAEEKEKPSPHIQIMKESDPKPGKAGLIEVISSTELNEEDLLTTPKYELSIVNNLSGKPQKIILTAALHGVRSVSECDLSVSKDDLMLEVPGKYRLLLNLPVLVNEDSTTATYNKANNTLTVTMLVEDNQGV
ncbi:hypothetical protein AB205_0027880 [Aquarana catesbeiana]|uniref:PIH1D1/2/3 CS-like domain-containing protein n=1 Tax=Aquarana catesbeiana TaxID=8400 RepID=A0A2G9S772_AQUCT|nr:hypothetical protein AB205_0027880 [Aquarana catesbeiana]